jgi:hypothetical protein
MFDTLRWSEGKEHMDVQAMAASGAVAARASTSAAKAGIGADGANLGAQRGLDHGCIKHHSTTLGPYVTNVTNACGGIETHMHRTGSRAGS